MVSRLKERIHQGYVGWQWDDGPVFVGEDSRKWAIRYGRATRHLEELSQLAELELRQKQTGKTIETLKAMQERLDVD